MKKKIKSGVSLRDTTTPDGTQWRGRRIGYMKTRCLHTLVTIITVFDLLFPLEKDGVNLHTSHEKKN